MDWKALEPGDPKLIDKIVSEYMSKGQFDHLRRQLLSAVDTKPSYQNVKQRMESTVRQFLLKQRWRPDISKNQLRDSLKRQIITAHFLRPGVKRIVDHIANTNAMDELRMSLDNITRDLLGVKEEPEPDEPMDTQIKEEENTENDAINENSQDQMTDDVAQVAVKEESPQDVEGEQTESKLICALESLEIPGEDVQSMESISSLIDAEMKPLPDAQAMEVDAEPVAPAIEDEFSEEDSDHSIINQMSPISAGSVSPPPPTVGTPIKRASDFIGKIPKVKKEDERDNSDIKESERLSQDVIVSKNGETELRRDKSIDTKPSSDRSKDRDKKYDSKSRDRSRERDRKDKDRRNTSKSSNDKDRYRRSDSRDKNKEKYRDKERNRHKDKQSSRSSHRSRDKSRDRSKDKLSNKEKEKKDIREKDERVQSSDDGKITSRRQEVPENNVSIADSHDEANSRDTVKTADETSQGSQESEKDNKVGEKRVFKITPMTTRSKGRKMEEGDRTINDTDNGEKVNKSQGKKKGKSSVKR